nr:hypothetical protein L203_02976 [Cryptococcus depauperatus CBS 7841]
MINLIVLSLILFTTHLTVVLAASNSQYNEAVFQAPTLEQINPGDSHDTLPEPPIGQPPFLTQDLVLHYKLDDVDYFTPHYFPSFSVESTQLPGFTRFRPITVLSVPVPSCGTITDKTLRPLIQGYLEKDDVIAKAWLRTVMVIPSDIFTNGCPVNISTDALNFLKEEMGTERVLLDEEIVQDNPVETGQLGVEIQRIYTFYLPKQLAGPFLARTTDSSFKLYPVFRMYSDIYQTFVTGIYPLGDGKGTYRTLDRVDEQGRRLIPVPSRLYTSTTTGSLSGKRVAIKDVYDIRGVPTIASSRVYMDWRGVVNTSASSVKKLEQAGCALVGKVKTTQWCVLYHVQMYLTHGNGSPFSPRGDQYQSCGSSSSGSACALAGYPWLDYAIGSDTTGSVRYPALVTGLYGNRPTTGMLTLDGVVPCLKSTDTASVLSRSPVDFKKFLETWYAESPINRRFTHLPRKLVFPRDSISGLSPHLTEMIEEFLRGTEKVLGTSVDAFNISEAAIAAGWTLDKMNDLISKFDEYVARQPTHIFRRSWEVVGKSLFDSYAQQHDGASPPFGSILANNWKKARDHPWSQKEYQEIQQDVGRFKKWFNEVILERDEETCSKAILVEPFALDEVPTYRETRLNQGPSPLGAIYSPFDHGRICSMADCPHYIVPIGQVDFSSVVSEKTEKHPIVLGLIAYPGCDFMLLELIQRLQAAGVIREVKTGRTAF